MQQATLDSGSLAFRIEGTGEPVVLIHGALIADVLAPLMANESLLDRYQFIHYHRRGYGQSEASTEPLTVIDHAADCAALLQRLGVERTHVLGHSYGGSVALQLAIDRPDIVGSLALLEPALMVGETAQGYRDALLRGLDRYRDVEASIVIDEFLRARWPEYRDVVDRELPGAMDQAISDAPTWFEREVPGLLQWQFGENEARRVAQPTLLVLGAESNAMWSRFGEVHRLLGEWIPDSEELVVRNSTHLMQLQNPLELASGLDAFWKRHPLQRR